MVPKVLQKCYKYICVFCKHSKLSCRICSRLNNLCVSIILVVDNCVSIFLKILLQQLHRLGFVSGIAQTFFPCVMDCHFLFSNNICTRQLFLYSSFVFMIVVKLFSYPAVYAANCIYCNVRFQIKPIRYNYITKDLSKPENFV